MRVDHQDSVDLPPVPMTRQLQEQLPPSVLFALLWAMFLRNRSDFHTWWVGCSVLVVMTSKLCELFTYPHTGTRSVRWAD
jgi:hypothetical protein